jgi:hypothetical protein
MYIAVINGRDVSADTGYAILDPFWQRFMNKRMTIKDEVKNESIDTDEETPIFQGSVFCVIYIELIRCRSIKLVLQNTDFVAGINSIEIIIYCKEHYEE